jgi:hypothetical protein
MKAAVPVRQAEWWPESRPQSQRRFARPTPEKEKKARQNPSEGRQKERESRYSAGIPGTAHSRRSWNPK